MEESLKKNLIKKIKEKQELSGIDDSVVSEFLEKVLKKYGSAKTETDLKILVSETRSLLRKISGRFQKTQKKRRKILGEEYFAEILKTHSSTSERLSFYPELKEIINSYSPKSILDLGCGLNPLALASSKTEYFACDIKQDELKILEKFFKKNKIQGKVFFYNLRKINSDLPEADICLIFKVLDILGENNHSLSRKIIQDVKCKILIVSFSTRKLSGKSMRFPERIWFERILSDISLPFKKIYSENEVFYIIEKSSWKEKFRSAGN